LPVGGTEQGGIDGNVDLMVFGKQGLLAGRELELNYIVFGVLPYCTLAIFVVGMIYRLYTWYKAPQPGAVTLTPAPETASGVFVGVVKEALFFPSLFKGDKTLWAFAWIFHVTLALIFVGHVRVVTDFPRLWAALGINADTMSAVSGGIAGVMILAAVLLLLIRRATVRRAREITSYSDIISLLLIVAILVTGNLMRFGSHFDLEITRLYFQQLATFSVTASAVPISGMLMVHFLLGQVLIMFIPFSKILHFGGIFFTQTVIQKA
jgi:nitrate reductase gamma subunit